PDFKLLVPGDAVFLTESPVSAVGELRPVPRVYEYRTAITRRPRPNRLVLKYRVFSAGDDEVPAGIKASGGRCGTEITHLPSRRRVENEDLPRHPLPPRLLRGQRGLKLLCGYSGFRALLPSHLGSVGAIDLDEVLLAGPTRQLKQANALGAAFASRLLTLLRSLQLQCLCGLGFHAGWL